MTRKGASGHLTSRGHAHRTAVRTPAPVAPPAYDEYYTYDALGNLTSKNGVGVYGCGIR